MSTYLCVYPPGGSWDNVQGMIVPSAQACSDIDPGTYLINLASSYQPSIQDIFAMPLASDMAQMWALGFGLPMLCYMVAWGYQTVISFMSDRR